MKWSTINHIKIHSLAVAMNMKNNHCDRTHFPYFTTIERIFRIFSCVILQYRIHMDATARDTEDDDFSEITDQWSRKV